MIISDPGKFEGEPSWAPVLWDSVRNGSGGDTLWDGDMPIETFTIDDDLLADLASASDPTVVDGDDLATLGTLHGATILLWESDQGFVHTRIVTQAEFDRIERDLNAQTDERERD